MRKSLVFLAIAVAVALPWTSTASAALQHVFPSPAPTARVAAAPVKASAAPRAATSTAPAPAAAAPVAASAPAASPAVSAAVYTTQQAVGTGLPVGGADSLYANRAVAVADSVTMARRRLPAPSPAPAPAPTPSRWVGFYESGCPSSITPLATLESQIATKATVVNFYVADSESFPSNRVQTITSHGSIPMITLEFWSTQTGGVASITSGAKDAYLRTFADAAKAYGGELWLRPFHEMNSNWYPWAGGTGGNSAAKVVAAWNHVRSVFASRGATNVKFVWCVNNDSVPNTSANSISAYWPGDGAVDILAIDGYNFGTSSMGAGWRPFSSVIGSSYTAVTALSAKPLVLAEVGCVEQGGSKASWITDMFAKITSNYPRIAGVCWFNVNDTTKGTDFRVETTTASLSAFKTAVGAGY